MQSSSIYNKNKNSPKPNNQLIRVYPNNTLTFTGASLPTSNTTTLDAPFFFHGTIISTGEELSLINSSFDKFPMIFLHEIVDEDFSFDEESK